MDWSGSYSLFEFPLGRNYLVGNRKKTGKMIGLKDADALQLKIKVG